MSINFVAPKRFRLFLFAKPFTSLDLFKKKKKILINVIYSVQYKILIMIMYIFVAGMNNIIGNKAMSN